MKQEHSRLLSHVMVTLLVMAAFFVGYHLNSSTSVAARPVWAAMMAPGAIHSTLDDTISLRPIQLFQEAFDRLQKEYVEPINKPDELTYSAIRGMLSELHDPYTRFMDPKEFKDSNDEFAGHFAGIGATLSMTEIPPVTLKTGEGTMAPVKCPVCGTIITDVKYYRVGIVDTLPKSPAMAAGLQGGDIIMKVNDVTTDGLMVGEVADKIRGPEGSTVKLTIARKGITAPLVVPIVRAQIEVPAVQTKMLDNQIGYLRVYTFGEKTVPETRAALLDFKKQKVHGIVLDLRGNPGGLLTECIKLSSMLLPGEDKVIVSTRGRDGVDEPYNRVEEQIYNGPLVVLVNKGSASASEILSGALKDYNRAKVIGENTFGKALVQSVLRLSDGSAMAVTTAHYYTPNGIDVAKKGVTPDIIIALDKDVKQISEKDNQAKQALHILKDEIALKK